MHSRNHSQKRPVAFRARVDKSNRKTRLDVSGAISRTRYSGRYARHLLSLQSHPLLINEEEKILINEEEKKKLCRKKRRWNRHTKMSRKESHPAHRQASLCRKRCTTFARENTAPSPQNRQSQLAYPRRAAQARTLPLQRKHEPP